MKRLDDSGQAFTEYAILMVGLATMFFITGAAANALYDGAFMDMLRGFGIYADVFDFVLSMPIP